jgi:ligand-binding SRPBCC domain-containing protein
MKFEHRFRVDAPQQVVAEFHRRATTLKAITPPPIFMQFHTPPPDPLGEGDSFTFTMWIGPLPFKWGSRIEEVSTEGFGDVQTQGAFAQWRHRHNFVRIDDQTTEVFDQVEARLRPHPVLGPVGLAMWLGLPILFAYRAWRTRKLLAG